MAEKILKQRKPKRKKRGSNKPIDLAVIRTTKMKLIGVICSLIITFLLGRVCYIKIVKGSIYEEMAIKQQVSRGNDKIIMPNRGAILDRNKETLATSNTVYSIILDVNLIMKTDAAQKDESKKGSIINATISDIQETLKASDVDMSKVRDMLSIDPATGAQKYKGAYFIIAKNIPTSTAMQFKTKNTFGVFLEESSHRNYIYNNLASNILGFIRGDSSSGLENAYNDEMQGSPGRVFRVIDDDKNVIEQRIPPVKGSNITTTIDFNIQKFAEDAIVTAVEMNDPNYVQRVGIIVMNPYTGEVIAMAQYPSFNPNDPTEIQYLTSAQLQQQLTTQDDEEKINNLMAVWRNFNISDTFEPGSIFKPVTVSAALEENVITPNDTFYCGGTKKVLDTDIKCWNLQGHGTQTVKQALANSCNIAMSDIAEKLGKNLFYKYQTDFGYAEKTGIDLPGESAVDSSSLRYSLAQLNPVELATSSFGQGFNNTPIQSINSFAAVINGGNLMKPYVVSQVVDEKGNVIKQNEPEIVKKVVSPSTSDYMRYTLQDVIDNGTGVTAKIEGYNIGGKTGTAQQGVRAENNYTTSIIGYLPVENPQYIALIAIDRPYVDENGNAASPGPILKELFQNIIKYKNIQPNGTVSPQDNLYTEENSFPLDDFQSMSIVDATKKLNKSGIDYEIVGSGDTVERQLPAPNSYVTSDATVSLYLKTTGVETELTEIPDVQGLTEAQAYDLLTKAELIPASFLVQEVQKESNVSAYINNSTETNLIANDNSNLEEASLTTENASDDTNDETQNNLQTPNPTQNLEITTTETVNNIDAESASTSLVVIEQKGKAGIKVSKGTEIKIKVK